MTEERLADLRKWAEEVAQQRKVKLNPDQKVVEAILKGLIRNEEKWGARYCPCRPVVGNPEKDRLKVCPCFWMMEDIGSRGICHCGLFVRG